MLTNWFLYFVTTNYDRQKLFIISEISRARGRCALMSRLKVYEEMVASAAVKELGVEMFIHHLVQLTLDEISVGTLEKTLTAFGTKRSA